MNDQDIRINALAQEFQQQIASMSTRGATLAAELASVQAKLKTAEEKIVELTKEPSDAPTTLHSIDAA